MEFKTELLLLNAIKPNPNNPRIIRDHKFEQLKKSIQEFPEMMNLREIVVDETMIILGGNMRFKACVELGIKETLVKIVSGLSEEQKKEFVLKDNLSYGEWDFKALEYDFPAEKLTDWGLDVPIEDVKHLEAKDDDFEIPADQIFTKIIIGDIIEIGPHRLMCGDSTEADNVSKLLNGEIPVLMVTDPPYGVNYDPNWRTEARNGKIKSTGKVLNDHRADWKETYSLFPGSVAYVWHAGVSTHTIAQNLIDCGFDLISQIIWNKSNGALSRGDIHWKHEPCWYVVKKGAKHNWQGARNIWSVWDIQNLSAKNVQEREGQSGHGTQKPIACMAIPIQNSTSIGQGVYDPFLGSGTTMIASHQLGRKCFAFELNPSYCQIIVNRMKKLDPTIQVKINGIEYDAEA